jgi:glycerol-3-phosphate acyltransferase PlsY
VPFDVLPAIVALIGGYLLGSIPFGLLFTRWAGLGDIRSVGSGNIGATNVLRTGNRGIAAATLICDAGKGAVAVLLAKYVQPDLIGGQPVWLAVFAAVGSFGGHVFPVWLNFKGGKGVATFLGTMIALYWPIGLAACATWLVVAGVFRISSLAALVSAALTPLYFLIVGLNLLALTALLLALMIFWSHRANIGRLLRGEEPRIGRKKRA